MDRRSTVRINAERLRASLKAGNAEPQPAPAEAAAEADQAMDRAIAGLTGVAEKLKTFDLNVTIGAEAAREVGAAMVDMKTALKNQIAFFQVQRRERNVATWDSVW